MADFNIVNKFRTAQRTLYVVNETTDDSIEVGYPTEVGQAEVSGVIPFSPGHTLKITVEKPNVALPDGGFVRLPGWANFSFSRPLESLKRIKTGETKGEHKFELLPGEPMVSFSPFTLPNWELSVHYPPVGEKGKLETEEENVTIGDDQ